MSTAAPEAGAVADVIAQGIVAFGEGELHWTVESFAINLNGSPSVAGVLTQARGERVEVVLQQGAASQPGTLTGSIVGVERQMEHAAIVRLAMKDHENGKPGPVADGEVLAVMRVDPREAEACAIASTVSTPGSTGLPGKCWSK